MVHYVNGVKYLTLFYAPEINRIVDGVGNVIHDIFHIITPNQLMLFKENRGMMQIRDVTNTYFVCLVYLTDEERMYERY